MQEEAAAAAMAVGAAEQEDFFIIVRLQYQLEHILSQLVRVELLDLQELEEIMEPILLLEINRQ